MEKQGKLTLIERNSNDPKMFWKTLKMILPMAKKIISPNINVNGSPCWDAKKIENAFNIFFTDNTASLTQFLEKAMRSIYDYITNNLHAATDDNNHLSKSPRIIIINTMTLGKLVIKCSRKPREDL